MADVALTFQWDEVDGAVMRRDPTSARLIRMATVSGFKDDPSITAEKVLYLALTHSGTPRIGQSIGTWAPRLVVRSIQLTGYDEDSARIAVEYSTLPPIIGLAGGGNAGFQITVSSGEVGRTFNMNPATGDLLYVTRDIGSGASLRRLAAIPAVQLGWPFTEVSVFRLVQGEFDIAKMEDSQHFIGQVNDVQWFGRRRGCWKLVTNTVTTSRYSNFYAIQSTARALGGRMPNGLHETWATVTTARQTQTGIPLVDQTNAAAWRDEYQREYEVGRITPDDLHSGVASYGMFPPTDFSAIFGFSGTPVIPPDPTLETSTGIFGPTT